MRPHPLRTVSLSCLLLCLLLLQACAGLHAPRDYPCLIQRLGSWDGFMALWAGVATPGQARRMVREARELAAKTVALFGRDLRQEGALHEYYDPDTGAPIINKGFQNWNYLVLNMIAWLEGRPVIQEFN